ncbi:MAG TPA: hypothetical protein DCQ37_07280 [Desulfobacteraceae bacterium]|nr:hypothetical protein [Desulfobacteraceae bacterium]
MIGGSNKVCGNDPLAVYRSLVSDKSVTTANIGTLTTLIYDTAVSQAGGLASVTPDILDDATAKVLKIFGFGISAGIDPIRTPIDSGNAASVIRASQALNELLMRLGKTPDERNLILTALAEDVSDGKSDGKS